MALQTFNPPIGPSPGTGHKPQMKILDAEFGDGYSQPTPDGINHMQRTVSLKWDALTLEQKDVIEDFFVSHLGTVPFYYRPYGAGEAHKWTCREFDFNTDDGIWNFRAELVQSFSNQT